MIGSSSIYRLFIRHVLVVAQYPNHGYVVQFSQSLKARAADMIPTIMGGLLYNLLGLDMIKRWHNDYFIQSSLDVHVRECYIHYIHYTSNSP